MTDIKPCPFCGGKADIFWTHYQVCVNCLSCDADGPSNICRTQSMSQEEVAIAAWNRGYAFVEVCKMAVDNYYGSDSCGDEQGVAKAARNALDGRHDEE